MDTKLAIHVPFDSKFLSGMMQAIQIHNNQHFEEELFWGLEEREATRSSPLQAVVVAVASTIDAAGGAAAMPTFAINNVAT